MSNRPSSITDHLKQIRVFAVKTDLIALGWIVYSSLLCLFLLALLVEIVLYLPSEIRTALWLVALSLGGVGFFILMGMFLLVNRNKVFRYRWSTLARQVGSLVFSKNDAVVNALQLERELPKSSSKGLSQSYIADISKKLGQLDLKTLFPVYLINRWKNITLSLLAGISLTIYITWNHSTAAVFRWTHPKTEFQVPKPFSLKSTIGDIHLLGGESTTLLIESKYAQPDTVFLRLAAVQPTENDTTNPRQILLRSSADSLGLYPFSLDNIYQDYSYQAFVPASHFWQAWKEVSSPEYRILVTDRPTMEDFFITIIPPKYSGLKAHVQEGNQANVQGLKGSTISIRLSSNRILARSFLLLNDEKIPLSTHRKRAEGDFILQNDGVFTVHLKDRRGITNRDPIPYHLQIIPDLFPELNVIAPPPIVELGEDMLIPIHLEIEDDFGFSNLQIGYEIQRPSYIQAEPFISIFSIPDLNPKELNQTIQTFWDLSDLGLMPEDEVHFHFELYDNDRVSGPKKSISGTFIARLPSLADLFSAMEEGEQSVMEEAELNLDDLKVLQDHLEKAELDLLKSNDIEWEQQQDIKKMLEKAKEEIEQFEKMAETLNAFSETGEKHGLFSPELMAKFKELQELVNDLISEDLLMNLSQIEEALQNLDMKDLMAAMDDLSENLQRIEQELDRFIDILKRIQAEQKLNEVTKRLEQLVEEQEVLDDKIRQTSEETDASTFARLQQEEKRNLDEFQNILDVMQDAASLMEEYSQQSAEAMEDLAQSDLAEKTESDLSQAKKQLSKQNPSGSKQSSQSALMNLQSFQQMAMDVQEQFHQETASEMAGKFQAIMRDILTLSKSQESLRETTANTPRNSPRVRDLAGQQQMLKDQLSQVMSSMMELSKETFAVTPEMGKAMGMAFAQMNESISKLAERNSAGSQSNQELAMKSLNEAARSIYNTIRQMQTGGSASGFEQFLEQMQNMAGQQQGINAQGMQLALGQMAASMQQALMQRMLSGQKQVRKSLQQLMDEMGQSGQQGLGDLGGIAKDMDEVIKDLQVKKYSRKTRDRQQRILSRMLDSQKSLTQRGHKEERRSKTASQEIVYSGPSGLPVDLGQRRNLTMEALNQAMKAGYSRDYQTMIRRYFNALGQADFLPEDNALEAESESGNE